MSFYYNCPYLVVVYCNISKIINHMQANDYFYIVEIDCGDPGPGINVKRVGNSSKYLDTVSYRLTILF